MASPACWQHITHTSPSCEPENDTCALTLVLLPLVHEHLVGLRLLCEAYQQA